MNRTERIKQLQTKVGAKADGIIGNETLSKFAAKYKKTRAQVAHFFGNIHHETYFTVERENMNYTAPRIMEIFGVGKHSANVTTDQAANLAGKPYALAERVYGLGNPRKARELGNTLPGDGYKYRGGGALQCTGGGDYLTYGTMLGIDLYNRPELITGEAYFRTAIAEFDLRKIWDLATDIKEASIVAVCRKVNGGLNGLKDRREKTLYYYNLMK
ncbi:glycoside hydrolase family 19 protein [Sphingobacterium spiritivorum]|uniref:glycoside hydrolase family 19 protein n=1 Tax=Sphingobacterium spiritivorum TaxID=258 RepID=UPI003DA53888